MVASNLLNGMLLLDLAERMQRVDLNDASIGAAALAYGFPPATLDVKHYPLIEPGQLLLPYQRH